MSDLDFYAHVATHCEVLGIGIGSGPGAWEATLGPDYLDDAGKGRLRRDYGLVELSFSATDGRMSCFGISVQVHRLLHGPCAPPSLVRKYGEFTPRAHFEELRSVILSLGCTVESDDPSWDFHRYRVPESGTRIFVIEDAGPDHQAGDIWAVNVSPAWWGRYS